jgi:hypothetical protein
MKRLIYISFILLLAVSCKKTKFSPEGPTDIRIRNLTDQNFTGVIVSTSEYTEDIDTIGNISKGETSEYFRFKKAYPNIEITATVNIGGNSITYSTGDVNYNYLQYIGQDRITYEVYIPNMNSGKLEISNRIIEEPLVLK